MSSLLKIGDKVIFPWRMHRKGQDIIGGWHPGFIIARRKDHWIVQVVYGGHEEERPAYEVKPYPRSKDEWP
jgi:hypothetical protein